MATPDVSAKIKRAIKGSDKRFVGGTKIPDKEDISFIRELLHKGEIKPIIDSEFSFDEMVNAHHRVDTGHKVGSVIVTL